VSLPSSYRSRRGHIHLLRVLPLVGCRSKTPIAKDLDDGRVEGKPKPRVQEIAEDDDLVITRPWYSLPARGSAGPNHMILREGAHVGTVNLASAEHVCLRDLLRDGIASSFWGHVCDLNAK
jgi:hypothetical protein